MADPQANPAQPGAAAPLFDGVVFSIVRNQSLTGEFAEEVATIIRRNGGVELPADEDTGKLSLEQVTHIIASTSDFPDYHTAAEAFIPIVKPEWVEASLSKNKLAQIRPYSPDPRLFFSGVTICCTDLPSGDMEAITGGVMAMGGQSSGNLTKLVTHIVALTEDSEKCQHAIAKGLKCKIVLPHWFDDCLKLGKRIDEGPYTLPHPDLTSRRLEDPVALPSDEHLIGASSSRPGGLPSPIGSPAASRQDLTVFKKKKVMLSSDLNLGRRLRGTIEDLITAGGGHITTSVHKANMLVCHHREGKDYQTASRQGKDVGNLAWLYYLLTHNIWTSPLRRLLHYPVAREGLPGFKKFRVSLSNYGGEARLYLENLVWAAGGEFTKTMRQDNTHLITARQHSEKCDAAKEWNIHMVNHLWLEDSYAKWEIQSVSKSKYNHFPLRTNLGEVVGQTEIDRHAIESAFFPQGDEGSSSEDEQMVSSRPMQVKDHNVSPVMPRNGGAVAAKALRVPPKVPERSTDGETPRRSKPRHDIKTPSTTRILIDGKENGTPSTTGTRGAKDRALTRLHELAPDIALYEKERKRVGGVVFGGRRASDEGRIDEPRVKRRSSHQSTSDEDEMDIDEEREAKRQKKAKALPPKMKLILTGYSRWSENPRSEDEEKRRLRELGILLVEDPSQCTHLAAPTIKRTAKFVTSVAYAPVMMSTAFLDHCLDNEVDELPAVDQFPLRDAASEKRFGFKIKDAIKRAQANERQLLDGTNVYCTAHVTGGYQTYKAIIEANGGRCTLFRPRSGSVAAKAAGEDEMDIDSQGRDPTSVYLISSDAPDDQKVWGLFRQMVWEQKKTPRVVKTDWLLDVAMSQRMEWHDRYEQE